MNMKAPGFSTELYKEKRESGHDATALETLRKLRERIPQNNLFTSEDKKEFDFVKDNHEKEYLFLQNEDAFLNLSPREQKQVKKDFNQKHLKEFMKKTFNKDID